MTNNEKPQIRKLGTAGWIVLLFILAAAGSILGTLIYLAIAYANSLGG